MLNLMYITNRPDIAQIAEAAGVDRIFVDLEYIGKSARQGGMDTVQSHHTIDDVKQVSDAITKAQLLVRVNPIHEETKHYISSEEEISRVIENGANIVMLPFFKTVNEVKRFVHIVDGRAKTMLLVETPEAVDIIDNILEMDGIDNLHIGLNDLSLAYQKKFMFELLTDGTVERLCNKFKHAGVPYGFGGIAAIGKGAIPAEMIIKEHYRLGSTCAILSRSFCDTEKMDKMDDIRSVFMNGLKEIRALEETCMTHIAYFNQNKKLLSGMVEAFVK
ncbi:MAG: aldolase/citrate lyase family protein [Clostridia bacterium]|nr:aldolase/citrate lyase family protein [Clostridia bacterium]